MPSSLMTSCEQGYDPWPRDIITQAIGYHNQANECHNFFYKGGIFSSFKIFNKKIKLQALNVY